MSASIPAPHPFGPVIPVKRKHSTISDRSCCYCNHLQFDPDFEALHVRNSRCALRTRIEGDPDNYFITIPTQLILREGFDITDEQRLRDCPYCRFLYDALNLFFVEPSMDWFQDAQRESSLFILIHVQKDFPLLIQCQEAIVSNKDWIHLRADIEVFCPDRRGLSALDFPCMHLALPEPAGTREDRECEGWLSFRMQNCAKAIDRMDYCYYTPNRLLHIDWDSEEIELWQLPRGSPGRPDLREMIEYATLSHCWSEDDPTFPRLLQSNILDWVQGVSFIHLPQAILDAARVAYKNNIHYLWVESLCIIQDNQQDLAEQKPLVGDYFRDSLVTIVAASSTSPNDSFLYPRKEDWITNGIEFTAPSGGSANIKLRRVYSRRTSPTDAIDESSRMYNGSFRRTGQLYRLQRCYEEALLGTRVISFTSAAVTVNCRRHNMCTGDLKPKYRRNDTFGGLVRLGEDQKALCLEDFPAKYSRAGVFEGMIYPGQGRQLVSLWFEAVQQYTARNVTVRPRDRLSGISGLAGLCPLAMRDKYLAGLWLSNLPEGLLWEVVLRPGQTNTTKITFPFKEQKAPSFSWASVDTKVAWKETFSMFFVPDARVIAASSLVEAASPFLDTEGGVVTLEGRLVRCEVSQTLSGTETGGKWTYAYFDVDEGGNTKTKRIPFVADGSLVMVKSRKAMRDRSRREYSKGSSRSLKKRIAEFESDQGRSHTFLTRFHHEFRKRTPTHGHKKIIGVAYVLCLGWRGKEDEGLRRQAHYTFEGLVLTPSIRYPGAFERIGCIRDVPVAAYETGVERTLNLV